LIFFFSLFFPTLFWAPLFKAPGGNFSPIFFLFLGGGGGSSVGIAADYGLDGGIESRWGRDFPPLQTDPGAHLVSCKMGTVSFPGVKCGRGVLLTTHPLLVFGNGRVELYLYPPIGPHRACNGTTLLSCVIIISLVSLNTSIIHTTATSKKKQNMTY